MNADIAAGKAALKEKYHWLNDAQIDNMYNYQQGTGSLLSTQDSDPVILDEYMTKKMF